MGKVTRKVVVTPMIESDATLQQQQQNQQNQNQQSRFNKNKLSTQKVTNISDDMEQVNNDEEIELIEDEEEEQFPYVDDEL